MNYKVRTISPGDASMGTSEASEWQLGDRVPYPEKSYDAAAWDRVSLLLSRRDLCLKDMGNFYVVTWGRAKGTTR